MGDVLKNLIEPLEIRFSWKNISDEQMLAAKEDMLSSFEDYSDEVLARTAQRIRETRKYTNMPTVGDIKAVLEKVAAEQPKAAVGVPLGDVAGNGWRRSAETGARFYRIERGTTEWDAWMNHYRKTGNVQLADFLDRGRDPHFVSGPYPPGFDGACGDVEGSDLYSGTLDLKLANDLMKTDLAREAARDGWILSLYDFAARNRRHPNEREIKELKAASKGMDEAYATCVKGGWQQASELVAFGDAILSKREKLRAIVMGDVK